MNVKPPLTLEQYLGELDKLDVSFDRERVKKAYLFAMKAHEGQLRNSGEEYIVHPISVSLILAELRLDEDTIIAGLLHDVLEDTPYEYDAIANEFGASIAEIVDGVTKIERIKYESKEIQQAENFRKMLLAMSEDLRVILVKLADRLHNMRTLRFKPGPSHIATSDETLEIYVPIAHRLGIFRMKWEMEDLAFRYKEPDKYEELVNKVDMKRREREKEISSMMEDISVQLDEMKIPHTISGRPKNLYSIYKKMTFKNLAFEEIHDILAIRVIVKEFEQCYSVLGLIHSRYKPMPGRFKDYIAMPKPNMYQSLHTTVLSENGQTFEVQIRTEEMHQVAEYGVAAHWKYKAKQRGEQVSGGTDFNWIEQMMEWQRDLENPAEFIDSVKMDLYNTHVYVFTPRGNVIELPDGSTPVDFAYKIHTDIGNNCVGAKVNGRIVPLNYQLKLGDMVEILTSKASQGPSRDWLLFVQSSQARNKIKNFFKKANILENIEKGKEMLEKELRKYNLNLKNAFPDPVMKDLSSKLTIKSLDQLFSSIGYGGISLRQVIPTIREHLIEKDDQLRMIRSPKASRAEGGVVVEGMDDMLVRFAKCCNPIPGDQIIGFITRGSGVTIHRSDCTNFSKKSEEFNRFIDVEWNEAQPIAHTAKIKVIGHDRPGLLGDVTAALSALKISIRGLSAKVNNDQMASLMLDFDVHNLEELDRAMKQLKNIKSIMEVHRL
ncbi:MAG: bifunctional (p)ppGpp synthetase/guanosine-3',5'-bis(diphosphate) 3'-pyrophosphohydrolase [Bacillota bacterium]|nr:bifunctional (p)ppGpp synthetase/guanosine-3',5'-bis(diphosphate) 3'-pyrophosphohydrolase [Bacillota bacterium]